MQLNDYEKLIAKFSACDVSQEFKYHITCLTALYNRERAVLNQQKSKEDTANKSVPGTKFDD